MPQVRVDTQYAQGTNKLPNVGQKVKYLPAASTECKEAEISSRARKATGRHKSWLNIKERIEEAKCTDWS